MKRLTLVLIVFVMVVSFFSPVKASDSIKVFYAGDPGVVKPALTLSGNSIFSFVDDPSQADVLFLNGVIPDPVALSLLIKSGTGLVLFMGPEISQNSLETLLGIPLTITEKSNPVSLVGLENLVDPIIKDITWNGSPQVRARYHVETPISSVQPLVTSYEDGEWLLWSSKQGNTFIINAFLNTKDNLQFQEWAYYNYLIYYLGTRADNQAPLSFADYPFSPVPHANDRNILLAIMLAMLISVFAVFIFVRRYSLKHPEELDRIVSDRAHFTEREANSEWENVGFHRPLGGFLVALSIGLILFIPLIIYQNLILPTYILPSAQALGIWGRVTQFFNLTWSFFDMGTSIAFIKYLSEYRVHDPKKGIQYGQLFVWWQALSGAIQVAIVISLASTLGPRSAFALYVWSVIIHSIIQLPGFYQVMRHALTGFQRLDYSRLLDIGSSFQCSSNPFLLH
jgi:hypothetical protein